MRNKEKAIIEQYDGPPVRIMEVCGTHTHEIFRLGIRKDSATAGRTDLRTGMSGLCDTGRSLLMRQCGLHFKKCDNLYFWRSCPCTGNKDESCRSQRKGRKDPDGLFSGRCRKICQSYIRRNRLYFCLLVLRQQLRQACLSVKKAKEERLTNYSLLTANKTMPGAYEALKRSADVFLYPGHVNAITGTALRKISDRKKEVSGVVAGFTAKELLTAFAVSLKKFQEGKPFFVNCYPRVVTEEGSDEAQQLIEE